MSAVEEGTGEALDGLIDATRALFHQMKATARELHGRGELTAGLRGVLQQLVREGPMTVPAMARSRPVSRQHIQVLVDRLRADGLVQLRENPAHRRSRLVAVTPEGRRTFETMSRRERALLARLELRVPAGRVRAATEVLTAFREALRHVGAEEPRTPVSRIRPDSSSSR